MQDMLGMFILFDMMRKETRSRHEFEELRRRTGLRDRFASWLRVTWLKMSSYSRPCLRKRVAAPESENATRR